MNSEFLDKQNMELKCQEVLSLDRSIRFVGVCSNEGKLLNIKYRDQIHPLLSDKELLYSIIKSVERYTSRKYSEEKLGPPRYSITAYENVKRATIPVKEGLVFVSFEGNGDEFAILKKILYQIKKPHESIYS